MFQKIRFGLLTLIAVSVIPNIYGDDEMLRPSSSDLKFTTFELSPSNSAPRNIEALSFNSGGSNIDSYQASNLLSGLFFGVEPIGTYTIFLDIKQVSSNFEAGITGIPGILGAPVESIQYRLTVRVTINDSKNNQIYSITKSGFYRTPFWIYDMYKLTNWRKRQMSKMYSDLSKQCKDDISGNANAINAKLRAALETFNQSFDELTADLPNGSRIAVMPFAGSDAGENNRVLGELTGYFFNSRSGYYLVDRNNIDAIIKEIALQGTPFVDQHTAIEVGRIAGAQVIITGNIDKANNQKRLFLQAIDVATSRIIGVTMAFY